MKKKLNRIIIVSIISAVMLFFILYIGLRIIGEQNRIIKDSKHILGQIGSIMENSAYDVSDQDNGLDKLFALFVTDCGTDLWAIDPYNYKIVASTNMWDKGECVFDFPLNPISNLFLWNSELSVVNIRGNNYYIYCEQSEDIVLGRIVDMEELYNGIFKECTVIIIFLILIFGLVIVVDTNYLNKNIMLSKE